MKVHAYSLFRGFICLIQIPFQAISNDIRALLFTKQRSLWRHVRYQYRCQEHQMGTKIVSWMTNLYIYTIGLLSSQSHFGRTLRFWKKRDRNKEVLDCVQDYIVTRSRHCVILVVEKTNIKTQRILSMEATTFSFDVTYLHFQEIDNWEISFN